MVTAAMKSDNFRIWVMVVLAFLNAIVAMALVPMGIAIIQNGKAIERVPEVVSDKLAPIVARQNLHSEWMAASNASKFTMSDFSDHQKSHQVFERDIQNKLHAIELQLTTVISRLEQMKEDKGG